MEAKIKYLKNSISNHEKAVAKVEKLRLGMLLNSVSRSSLKGVIRPRAPFTVGPFEISFNGHDTGVSVKVWVVNGEDKLAILNGTYWYSEATYGFNQFTRVSGAWDDSFDIEIEKIRNNEIEFLIKANQEHKNSLTKMLTEREREISKFEAAFK